MTRSILALTTLAALGGCAPERRAEDPDWYSDPGDRDVEETVEFTDQGYTFPASGPGFGDLELPPEFTTWFAPDDPAPQGCDEWVEDESGMLPIELTGMVTIHPRMYFKVSGCLPADDRDIDSDEKYYGSFFIEDATGGVFVLGDSKVAHFDMGDRVVLRVRAIKNNFDLKMVAVHDVVSIDRGPYPIHYTATDAELGDADVGSVRRVVGTVIDEPDTFGEFHIENSDGVVYSVGLDVELNRRGVHFDVGSELQVSAPVLFSFSTYTLVVMKIGQIEVLSD